MDSLTSKFGLKLISTPRNLSSIFSTPLSVPAVVVIPHCLTDFSLTRGVWSPPLCNLPLQESNYLNPLKLKTLYLDPKPPNSTLQDVRVF